MPRLLHATSSILLGPLWFAALVTLWATGLGLVVTLLGLPVIWLTLVAARWMATAEIALAREWLGADIRPPATQQGWALLTRLRDRTIWSAQLYLLLRFVVGAVLSGLVTQFVVAIVHGHAILATALGLLAVAVAAGLASDTYERLARRAAERLLSDRGAALSFSVHAREPILAAHLVTGVCILVWAFTGEGYFWPAWVAIGVGMAAGLAVALVERSKLLADAVVVAGCFAIWALAGGGYLWPVWPALGIAVATGIAQLGIRSERVRELTATRAEVVGAQEDELRRIERDLHDGAQARLVSLSMSLGLAESRLDEDPARARELMAEAQEQARTAIKELRDLARGIAPPVLQDRGLAAAIEALTATAPLPVEVKGDGARFSAAVERAGYFVAAEAVANALKHAHAQRLRVVVDRFAGMLTVEVSDDGDGGANPLGSGLVALRRRVEAVDGRLEVVSAAGQGTTVRASLPCASS